MVETRCYIRLMAGVGGFAAIETFINVCSRLTRNRLSGWKLGAGKDKSFFTTPTLDDDIVTKTLIWHYINKHVQNIYNNDILKLYLKTNLAVTKKILMTTTKMFCCKHPEMRCIWRLKE